MWATKMTRSLGLVALLALAACGTDYSGEGDPNPDPGPGDGCESLTELECRQEPDCAPIFAPGVGFVECGDNEVVPEGCGSNSDCPENYYCEYSVNDGDREAPGACFCPDCIEGEDCPPCDCGMTDPVPPSEGQCVPEPLQGCFDDSDCGRGERCDFSQDPGGDNGVGEDEPDCLCPPCEEGEDCGPCDCGRVAPPAPEGVCVTDTQDCYDDSECPGDQICSFDVQQMEPMCDCSGDMDNCDCGDEAFIAPAGVCIDPPRFECFDDADCPNDMECSFDGEGFAPDEDDCACPPCEEGEDCEPCNCADPEPAPRPDGVCVDRDEPGCGDGSQLVCDALEPLCERGSEAFVRDGCWVCLDPDTCDDGPDECFGAWVDEEGTCRSGNDGVLDEACCEMPPINEFMGGLMHNDCAPHDAPALTFVLTPEPMACEMDLGSSIRITTWGLDRLFENMSVTLGDGMFEGTAQYCPGGGQACSAIQSGELYFEFLERGEIAVGGGFFEVDGQFINAFFEAPHCDVFDVGFCG